MGKMTVTQTELVWLGKPRVRNESPQVRLPFHLRERLATGQAGETGKESWRNKLLWGDNLLVMGALLEQCADKIDLIYIDPPFATGADFVFATPIGDGEPAAARRQPVIEEKAYRDTWGRGLSAYLSMLWPNRAASRKSRLVVVLTERPTATSGLVARKALYLAL